VKNKSTRAIGYCRVSTAEQAQEGLSIAAQKAAIENYAALRGLELFTIITDEGISASKPLKQRPGGSQLLAAVEQGKAHHVVAVKLDRLFRNALDALATLQAWEKAGIALHIIDLGGTALATDTAVGRFLFSVLAAIGEMERNLIAERTRTVLRYKRQNGQVFNHEPFGFVRDGDRLVPDPNELRIVSLVMDLHARGLSFRAIARTLNDRGIPSKRGKQWSHEMVRRLVARALSEKEVMEPCSIAVLNS